MSYEKLKVAELRAECEKRGIDLGKKRLKKDIRQALESNDASNGTSFQDSLDASVTDFLESESSKKAPSSESAPSSSVQSPPAVAPPSVDSSKMFEEDSGDEEAAYGKAFDAKEKETRGESQKVRRGGIVYPIF